MQKKKSFGLRFKVKLPLLFFNLNFFIFLVLFFWVIIFFLIFFTFLSVRFSFLSSLDLNRKSRAIIRDRNSCLVDYRSLGVHYDQTGNNNFSNAWIQFVNDDNTIQVYIINTRLIILFKTKTNDVSCYHKGWVVPVTIEKCFKNQNDRCDFNLPYIVYVRGELADIVNWRYIDPVN
jgi:hypothetical protein